MIFPQLVSLRSPWKARECFQGRRYSKESDVWAFGIVLWEMFMKTVPFQNMDDDTVIPYIVLVAVPVNCIFADVGTNLKVMGRLRTLSNSFVKLSDVERKPLDILSDLSETVVYCLSDPRELVSDLTVSLRKSKCTLVQDYNRGWYVKLRIGVLYKKCLGNV
jgi:serine/threonine protein kinase